MAHGYPDYEGGKSGLYLKPEWAAKEGTDKNLFANNTDAAWDATAQVSYAVPVAKKLYITQLSAFGRATLAANSDNNQIVVAEITVGATIKGVYGGNGGVNPILSKPIVVDGGSTVTGTVTNSANHNCLIGIMLQGYEVDV